VSPAPL
jgi:hypothetical protein